jgi:hypothetical protein
MFKLAALKERAFEFAPLLEENFLELAKVLRMINDLDPGQFRRVYEKLRLGKRKAHYLVEISKRFEGSTLPKSRLNSIGWTKVQIIGKHLTRKNADKLLRLAEENTVRNLKLLMQDKKPMPKTHCVLMYFSPRQYRVFENAIAQHRAGRKGRGIVSKEQTLVGLISRASS